MTSPKEPPRSTLPDDDAGAPRAQSPSSLPPVQYKGEPLDAARGPGLGCFWTQLVVLAVLIVLTPVSVYAGWPAWASAALLFLTILLLLFAGQTIIFLLRLVAAERRQGRRRPMAAARTRTVGELEDEERETPPTEPPADPHVRE
ncbi:MAG TPA: hypothetical protein VGK63_01100 [Candidatus Limnocylindrales bacterium]